MNEPTFQPMFEFRFLALPGVEQMQRIPKIFNRDMATQCAALTKASRSGRLGPILKVEGGLIFGELAGYVTVGPDTAGIVAAPGILKPA